MMTLLSGLYVRDSAHMPAAWRDTTTVMSYGTELELERVQVMARDALGCLDSEAELENRGASLAPPARFPNASKTLTLQATERPTCIVRPLTQDRVQANAEMAAGSTGTVVRPLRRTSSVTCAVTSVAAAAPRTHCGAATTGTLKGREAVTPSRERSETEPTVLPKASSSTKEHLAAPPATVPTTVGESRPVASQDIIDVAAETGPATTVMEGSNDVWPTNSWAAAEE
jgi:hypothetical protein